MLISAPDFGRAGDAAIRLLRDAGCEIIPNPKHATLTEEELLALVADADAIIAGTEPITARVLAAAPRLKIITRRGVGLDSVDVEAATACGVAVTTTAGALTDTVADHALGLMLAVARKIPYSDRMMKAGRWERALGVDIGGKTLGIVGFGAIGRAVASRAAGFGMRLLACDVAPAPEAAASLGVTLCDLPTLLASSDIVTLHVPLTPATRHLIDDAALRRMRPTAILINTSRGDVVDEQALVRALREGRLAGAGLDVFHDEPVRDVALVGLENVVATPHVASFTLETVLRMERSCADAVLAALRGERPVHTVNPEVYARRPTAR